jgi:hypothetical protein
LDGIRNYDVTLNNRVNGESLLEDAVETRADDGAAACRSPWPQLVDWLECGAGLFQIVGILPLNKLHLLYQIMILINKHKGKGRLFWRVMSPQLQIDE